MYDNAEKLGSRQLEIPDELERLEMESKEVIELCAKINKRLESVMIQSESNEAPSISQPLRNAPLAIKLAGIHSIIIDIKRILEHIDKRLEL